MLTIVGRKIGLRLSYATAVAVAVVSFAGPTFALGTAEQRAACTPDVFRLCGAEIPNVDKIVACLKKEKPHLSPACRAVFNAPAATQHATRSLGSPATQGLSWCDFHTGTLDEQQQTWLKWCGPAAQMN
jgi:hypothetical protein